MVRSILARVLVFGSVFFLLFVACKTFRGSSNLKDPGDEAGMSEEARALLKECRDQIAQSNKLLQDILAVKGEHNERNTLVPYNEMMIALGNAAAKSDLMAQVHPDKTVQSAGETCTQEVNKLSTDLSLNRDLYQAFKLVNVQGLEADSQRLVKKTLEDFVRSGVDKDDATREKIKKLNEELVTIGQDFDRIIREDVRTIELSSPDDMAGLPDDYIKAHTPTQAGRKITINTDYPDYTPFMQFAKRDDLRKQLLMVSRNRGYPKNIDVLNNMLAKRYELAQILGYPNWAAYVAEDKMIRTDKAIAQFIDDVAKNAGDRANFEYGKLVDARRQDDPQANFIGEWQRVFYEEKIKASQYAVDARLVREYFPSAQVKKGILDLTSQLYGLRYEKATDAKLWHPSVESYDVFDASSGDKIGRIYLDLYPRENKYKHAAQFPIKSGVIGYQVPEGALVCNFPQPTADNPGLMDHDDVVTIFHEFGHLMHHVIGGHQRWTRFSGVATEWDFVEAPSQFMEEWAWDFGVLQKFAFHYKTGKPIPADLVKKMRDANTFGVGVQARHQMFYASVSLNFHNQNPAGLDTTELLKKLQAKYSKFPYTDGTHFQTSFGHLNGYSAIYYTYMWSLVIAKDFLSAFRTQQGNLNLLNQAVAQRYRDSILVPGGSKDAADLVKDFLGRPFQYDEFKKWLNGG